jgi:hypothetical protein
VLHSGTKWRKKYYKRATGEKKNLVGYNSVVSWKSTDVSVEHMDFIFRNED